MSHLLGDHETAIRDKLTLLRDMIARHAAMGSRTAIDGVRVASINDDTMHHSMSGTVFALIVQGAKVLCIGEHTYKYRAGQFLVSSMDLPVTGTFVASRNAKPALGFGLELRSSTISELLLESHQTPAVRVIDAPASATVAVADADSGLLDAVIRMLSLLDAPDQDRAILAPLIEREIVWRLLSGPLGMTVRQLGVADKGYVGKAVRWLAEHYAEEIRVDDLAQMCSVSVSVLHRDFKAVTGTSPLQFQKMMRLQRARLLLAAGSNVSTAGHQVGYGSISQFSREYRRQFGLPPSRDAARMTADRRDASAGHT